MTDVPQQPGRIIYQSRVPFETDRVRAAAVYCSDGRFGDQIDDLLHDALGLPRYDRLAVPGGAACLAHHFASFFEQEAVVRQLQFLVTVHGLRRIVLVGHERCAYYSQRLHVSAADLEACQRADLAASIQRVRSLADGIHVDAYYAHTHEGRVFFEALAL